MKTMNPYSNRFELLNAFQLSTILGGDGGPVDLDEQDIDMPDIKSTP